MAHGTGVALGLPANRLGMAHLSPMTNFPLSLAALLLAAAPASADLLSGRVLDSAGLPLAACNLDVIDVVTGNDMALAGDTTDAAGLFSIDVPTASNCSQ